MALGESWLGMPPPRECRERDRGLCFSSPGGEMVVGERESILWGGGTPTPELLPDPDTPHFFILVEPNLVAAKLAVVKVMGCRGGRVLGRAAGGCCWEGR